MLITDIAAVTPPVWAYKTILPPDSSPTPTAIAEAMGRFDIPSASSLAARLGLDIRTVNAWLSMGQNRKSAAAPRALWTVFRFWDSVGTAGYVSLPGPDDTEIRAFADKYRLDEEAIAYLAGMGMDEVCAWFQGRRKPPPWIRVVFDAYALMTKTTACSDDPVISAARRVTVAPAQRKAQEVRRKPRRPVTPRRRRASRYPDGDLPEDMLPSALGPSEEDVRDQMRRFGILTMTSLADRLGLTQVAVSNWKTRSGKNKKGRAPAFLWTIFRLWETIGKATYAPASSPSLDDIDAFRDKHGLSRVALADLCGFQPSTISCWYNRVSKPKPWVWLAFDAYEVMAGGVPADRPGGPDRSRSERKNRP